MKSKLNFKPYLVINVHFGLILVLVIGPLAMHMQDKCSTAEPGPWPQFSSNIKVLEFTEHQELVI